MNLVLDTNAYSNWRRFGHWERLLVQAELVWVPSIVLGELRAGFLNGRFAVKNESKLADFLSNPVVQVATVDAPQVIYMDLLSSI
jgi:predicted nucleic acid-binding protein